MSLRPREGWCHDVLEIAAGRIAVENPRIFKTQETQPGAVEKREAAAQPPPRPRYVLERLDIRRITI